jgi:hypothetical protein
VETAELRVKVARMQEVVADLPALQEELQQLQAAHEASLEQSRQLQAKVCYAIYVCLGWLAAVRCLKLASMHTPTAVYNGMSSAQMLCVVVKMSWHADSTSRQVHDAEDSSSNLTYSALSSLHHPWQAEELSELQEERSSLLATLEEAEKLQQQLERLRSCVRDMSPLRQQLAEASKQLSELQGIEERLLDYRAEIARLEDSGRELQQALQMQAAITAEVSMLQREYDALAVQAQHAQRLQEEIPRMQVREMAGYSTATWAGSGCGEGGSAESCSACAPVAACWPNAVVLLATATHTWHWTCWHNQSTSSLDLNTSHSIVLTTFLNCTCAIPALCMLLRLLLTCWMSWRWSTASSPSWQTRRASCVLRMRRWLRRCPGCQS